MGGNMSHLPLINPSLFHPVGEGNQRVHTCIERDVPQLSYPYKCADKTQGCDTITPSLTPIFVVIQASNQGLSLCAGICVTGTLILVFHARTL